ncbi:uncharacterized protein L201_005536 [Kwoniella dendrophila CBS 6074]|uniref:Uncharacterized protein n=1 Tax=Kwoniella dendrophila CBS 6074 TaxID=1295534 RepID=A0AAX4K179_9TREE
MQFTSFNLFSFPFSISQDYDDAKPYDVAVSHSTLDNKEEEVREEADRSSRSIQSPYIDTYFPKLHLLPPIISSSPLKPIVGELWKDEPAQSASLLSPLADDTDSIQIYSSLPRDPLPIPKQSDSSLTSSSKDSISTASFHQVNLCPTNNFKPELLQLAVNPDFLAQKELHDDGRPVRANSLDEDEETDEILPFTPGTPNKMKGWVNRIEAHFPSLHGTEYPNQSDDVNGVHEPPHVLFDQKKRERADIDEKMSQSNGETFGIEDDYRI